MVGGQASREMADTNQEAEELENWIDDTREKIFKVDIKIILRQMLTMALLEKILTDHPETIIYRQMLTKD